MTTDNKEEPVPVPTTREPQFPVNLTSWKHYDGLRLVAMAILIHSLIGFLETAYVTTVRIDEIRAEARATVCSRGKVGSCVDTVNRYLFGKPTEHQLVERTTAKIVCRRRLWSAAYVAGAFYIVWAVFGAGKGKVSDADTDDRT